MPAWELTDAAACANWARGAKQDSLFGKALFQGFPCTLETPGSIKTPRRAEAIELLTTTQGGKYP